jgi:aminoglycoside 2''-phosphotransferase
MEPVDISKTTVEQKIARIKTIFPDVIRKIHANETGEDFFVLEINEEWIFRFPRNEYAYQALQREKRLLPELRKRQQMPVPEIDFSEPDFIGYHKIRGIPLTPKTIAGFGNDTRKRCAWQFGDFLSVLHAFSLETAYTMGMTEGWDGWRTTAYELFIKEALPYLSRNTARNVLSFFDLYFSIRWNKCLVHGDLYLQDHVFFDPKTEKIAGIIDFGDATIEDPAHDFQCLLEDGGEQFFQEITQNYRPDTGDDLLEKTRLRIAARPLFDAGYALERGFHRRFTERISEIENRFENPYSLRDF